MLANGDLSWFNVTFNQCSVQDRQKSFTYLIHQGLVSSLV